MGRGGGVGACLFGEVGPSVVMPNHAHGIIVLHATVGASLVGAQSGNHRATTTRATTRVALRSGPLPHPNRQPENATAQLPPAPAWLT